MTFHAFAAYLKYCWQAKGRHGVHSPFVYDFIDRGLRRKTGREEYSNPSVHAAFAESSLFTRVCRHFGIEVVVPASDSDQEPLRCYEIFEHEGRLYPETDEPIRKVVQTYMEGAIDALPFCIDLLHLHPVDGRELYSLWNKYECLVSRNTIVMVDRIHATRAHTAAWNAIRTYGRVRLSIDLHQTGLLFFREEFLVKQHFVLKH